MQCFYEPGEGMHLPAVLIASAVNGVHYQLKKREGDPDQMQRDNEILRSALFRAYSFLVEHDLLLASEEEPDVSHPLDQLIRNVLDLDNILL